MIAYRAFIVLDDVIEIERVVGGVARAHGLNRAASILLHFLQTAHTHTSHDVLPCTRDVHSVCDVMYMYMYVRQSAF